MSVFNSDAGNRVVCIHRQYAVKFMPKMDTPNIHARLKYVSNENLQTLQRFLREFFIPRQLPEQNNNNSLFLFDEII